MKIAVFPGSFDPITKGHVDIIYRAVEVFDEVFVAVGVNSQKQTLYSLDQRLRWLEKVFEDHNRIKIGQFSGLTVNYCKDIGSKYLVRGLRNASDFDYEKTISQLNYIIGDEIETVFFISQPEFSHISSTIVREIIKGKGRIDQFVPESIASEIAQTYKI